MNAFTGFRMVLELAQRNAISLRQAGQDTDLHAEYIQQQEALEIVLAYIAGMIAEGKWKDKN